MSIAAEPLTVEQMVRNLFQRAMMDGLFAPGTLSPRFMTPDELIGVANLLNEYLADAKTADAQQLPPPDVPPGTLLDEERIAEFRALLAATRGDIVTSAYAAYVQMAGALLAERSRLIGLLRDLSSDDATERYNAGHAAGRDEGMRIICEAITERIRSLREAAIAAGYSSDHYAETAAYERLLEYLRTVVKRTEGHSNG